MLGVVRWRRDRSASLLALVLVVTLVAGPAAAAAAVGGEPAEDLWQPSPGQVPEDGSWLYVEFPDGTSRTVLADDAALGIWAQRDRSAWIRVDADAGGHGRDAVRFDSPLGHPQLAPGYYPDAGGEDTAERGRLGIALREEPVCAGETGGRFAIDEVVYDEREEVLLLAARFERSCDGEVVVRGATRWEHGTEVGTSPNPGPVPDGLWQPSEPLPAEGTLVHFDSEAGDPLGGGARTTFVPTTARLTIEQGWTDLRVLRVAVAGDQRWFGEFSLPMTDERLAPGYYGELPSIPNPMRGGLRWFTGESCTSDSWVVVDEVGYEADLLEHVELRFSMRCEDADGSLNGLIRYRRGTDVADPVVPTPTPQDAWSAPNPPPGTNWLVLEGEPGEWVSEGRRWVHPVDRAPGFVDGRPDKGKVTVSAGGWSGQFHPPDGHQLKVGTYDRLLGPPIYNPMRGAVMWSGHGRGCSTTDGSFTVDEYVVQNGRVLRLRVRFAQPCQGPDGRTRTLRGELRYDADAPVYAPPPPTTPRERFSDVPPGPHRDAILAVAAAGIASGHADGTYRPDEPVTRGQMATFLMRAAELPPTSRPHGFPDVTGGPHEDAIAAIAARGITSGHPDGSFRPADAVTRAQMATFLVRAFDLEARAPAGFRDVTGGPHAANIGGAAAAGIAGGYPDGTFRPHGEVTRAQMASFLARALGLVD